MFASRPNRMLSIPWLVSYLVVALLLITIVVRSESGSLVSPTAPPTKAKPGELHDYTMVDHTSESTAGDHRAGDVSHAMRFTTTIHRPSGPPKIELQHPDPQGRMGSIACSTCHSVRDPDFANRRPADLDQFHQNMPMDHGTLSCYSCHNPDDADTLRLADSTAVEYPEVMTLCAQCHGTQARDYQHGAHGGMNGYWDLSRGGRTRNNCIDCHDPHVPKFPSMKPTFKPRDRFLSPTSEASHE